MGLGPSLRQDDRPLFGNYSKSNTSTGAVYRLKRLQTPRQCLCFIFTLWPVDLNDRYRSTTKPSRAVP